MTSSKPKAICFMYPPTEKVGTQTFVYAPTRAVAQHTFLGGNK